MLIVLRKPTGHFIALHLCLVFSEMLLTDLACYCTVILSGDLSALSKIFLCCESKGPIVTHFQVSMIKVAYFVLPTAFMHNRSSELDLNG